jgi:DHA1 family multidrug resistance protein-like MFS transporter
LAAATVLVASISPTEEMGYTLGLLQTGIYAGASLGPALGGFLSDLLGFRANFFITAGFLVAAALIVIRLVGPESPVRAAAGAFTWRRLLPDFSPLAGSSGLLALLLISGALQAANSTISPILPLFIQSISPEATRVGSTTGLILGLSALAAALAAIGLGRVSYRIGYERTLAFCLAGAFLIFLPQGFVRTPLQLLVLRMIGGAMIGGSEPSVNAMIAMRAPKSRQGAVFGLTSAMNNVGAAVGPMIGATVSAAFGYSSAFFTAAAVLLASAIAARSLRAARRTPL